METGALGAPYAPGQIIVQQGAPGECMYVILEGKVEVFIERDGGEVSLKCCREGDFLGELALFNREQHAASARALEATRVLSIDRKTFLRRIQEDPTLAFGLVQSLCQQVKELNNEVALLNTVVRESLHEHLRQRDAPAP
ncbi:MAG: cyclic nucleotide-binding domain-containing protein [Anaerolineales bacterium]|nr:cyclic nucleotide-binding domain-containing protein [Anaerolineales bacterium]